MARWSERALAASLLALLALTAAAAGAALQPQREASVVISYGCDSTETSPG